VQGFADIVSVRLDELASDLSNQPIEEQVRGTTPLILAGSLLERPDIVASLVHRVTSWIDGDCDDMPLSDLAFSMTVGGYPEIAATLFDRSDRMGFNTAPMRKRAAEHLIWRGHDGAVQPLIQRVAASASPAGLGRGPRRRAESRNASPVPDVTPARLGRLAWEGHFDQACRLAAALTDIAVQEDSYRSIAVATLYRNKQDLALSILNKFPTQQGLLSAIDAMTRFDHARLVGPILSQVSLGALESFRACYLLRLAFPDESEAIEKLLAKCQPAED
jgi:hypothetical protein